MSLPVDPQASHLSKCDAIGPVAQPETSETLLDISLFFAPYPSPMVARIPTPYAHFSPPHLMPGALQQRVNWNPASCLTPGPGSLPGPEG